MSNHFTLCSLEAAKAMLAKRGVEYDRILCDTNESTGKPGYNFYFMQGNCDVASYSRYTEILWIQPQPRPWSQMMLDGWLVFERKLDNLVPGNKMEPMMVFNPPICLANNTEVVSVDPNKHEVCMRISLTLHACEAGNKALINEISAPIAKQTMAYLVHENFITDTHIWQVRAQYKIHPIV